MIINNYIGYSLVSWFIISWDFQVSYKLPLWLDLDWRNQAEDFLNYANISKPPSFRWWTPTYYYVESKPKYLWCPILGPWINNYKLQSLFEFSSFIFPILFIDVPGDMFIYSLCFFGLLICLSLIDLKVMLLPDVLVYPLLWFGIIKALNVSNFLRESITGVLLGFLILFIIQQGFKLLRGKDGMGGGDVKLLAAIGAWVGSTYVLPTLLLACLLSLFIFILQKLFFKADVQRPYPFGPSLALAGGFFYIVVFFLQMSLI